MGFRRLQIYFKMKLHYSNNRKYCKDSKIKGNVHITEFIHYWSLTSNLLWQRTTLSFCSPSLSLVQDQKHVLPHPLYKTFSKEEISLLLLDVSTNRFCQRFWRLFMPHLFHVFIGNLNEPSINDENKRGQSLTTRSPNHP